MLGQMPFDSVSNEEIAVIFNHGVWGVVSSGRMDGPYGTRKDAIEAALLAARAVGAKRADVLVQCNNNEFRTAQELGFAPTAD